MLLAVIGPILVNAFLVRTRANRPKLRRVRRTSRAWVNPIRAADSTGISIGPQHRGPEARPLTARPCSGRRARHRAPLAAAAELGSERTDQSGRPPGGRPPMVRVPRPS